MKKILLRLLLPLAALLILAGSAYVLLTESGLNWLFRQVMSRVDGLSVESVQGRLTGSLILRNIRYTSDPADVQVRDVFLDWKPEALLLLRAHVTEFRVEGVSVETRESIEQPPAETELPEIKLPLDVIIENASIGGMVFYQEGKEPVMELKEILLGAATEKEALRIKHLRVTTDDAVLGLEGSVIPSGDYPLDVRMEWELRPEGFAMISGKGEVSGSLRDLNITQRINEPFSLELNAVVRGILQGPVWSGDVTAPGFNLRLLRETLPDVSVSGKISAEGTPDNYTYSLKADLSGNNIPATSLSMKGTGTRKNTVIEEMHADLLGGTVTGNGSAVWSPHLSWQVNGQGESLNPGLQWPEWPGALTFALESSGNIKEKSVTIDGSKLSVRGTLRERPVRGNTRFSLSDETVHLPELTIGSGRSHMQASGEVSQQWKIMWDAEIPDLEDIIPGGAGVITGKGHVSGERHSPDITAHLTGDKISAGEYGIGSLALDMDIDASDVRDSRIDIISENIRLGEMKLNSVHVRAQGKKAFHTMNAAFSSDDKRIEASVEGAYEKSHWQGLINSLAFNTRDYGTWTLKDPEKITLSAEEVGTGRLCFVDADAEVCVKTHRTGEGEVTLNAEFKGVPLSMFKAAVPEHTSLDGEFEGSAELTYGADKKTAGTVVLSVPEGAISYEGDEDALIGVPFEELGVEGELDGNALDLKFAASLKERGVVKGSVILPHFDPLDVRPESQALRGALSMDLHTLDLIPAFTSLLEEPAGAVTVDMTAGGTVSRPDFTGTAELRDGSALVPDLGINIRDVHARVKGSTGGDITLNAGMSSGGGKASIEGHAGFREKGISMDLRILGENFEAVKMPELRLLASPDITVRLNETQVNIEGTLIIPEASIEPRDLSNAVARSGDVHIIDSRVKGEEEKKRKIFSNVKVVLGEKVRFKGFGLAGGIEGALLIQEVPDTPTRGKGELNITNGVYKAYGQELNIEKGRLLFVGLVDNPALDIRAVRRTGDVTSGVNVAGTLRSPVLTLFSNPAMDQGDALSYLLFGRPVNRLSGSEGDQLYGAASSAALSGGEFIAKKIGAVFGLEEVEIEKGDTAEEATLFMGKYLSPRLYVSYGVGLFEPINILRLRYHLTPRWTLQSEYGLESGGDVLYSIER